MKALAYAARGNSSIAMSILEFPNVLEELVECLYHPYIEVKIQVSSLIASLRKHIAAKSSKKLSASLRRKLLQMKSQ